MSGIICTDKTQKPLGEVRMIWIENLDPLPLNLNVSMHSFKALLRKPPFDNIEFELI